MGLLLGCAFVFCFSIAASADSICDIWSFPADFKFGAGSASYQVEGAYNADGKGVNFYDWYLHSANHTFMPENGDVAADFYHKFFDDVQLMKEIGLNHFRFSLSWSRILPNGYVNEVNQAGVDFYNNLIDALIENNIEPVVTIFHWDIPIQFIYLGGWTNPNVADRFAEYADLVFELFGDRVKIWGTVNEPLIYCQLVLELYQETDFPHIPLGHFEYLCLHHIILGHAKAYRRYESKYKDSQGGKIGIVHDLLYSYPLNSSVEEDVQAAERANTFNFGCIMHPLVYGDYPSEMKTLVAENSELQHFPVSRLPSFTEEEKTLINGTYDLFMVNYYASQLVTSAPVNDSPSYTNDIQVLTSFSDWPYSPAGFPVYNEGFRSLLQYYRLNYGDTEIFITENGYGNNETENWTNDVERIEYTKDALYYVRLAMCEDEVNVTGYTMWSLLDSYEWNGAGYKDKYGLIHVDFASENLTRTLKESAYYYRNLIRSHQINATSE